MQAIDFSLYAPITSTTENPINTNKVYTLLALTNNQDIPTTNTLIKFGSSDEVGAFFGLSSNEYLRSIKYFSSYLGAQGIPPYIYFGKFISEDISPYLKSGVVSDPASKLTELKTITSGNLTYVIDGTSYSSTAINLSAATSLSNVAALIKAKILADHPSLTFFDIEYDGQNNIFVVSTTEVGDGKTLDYFSSTPSTGLATSLQLTKETNAILSQGATAKSVPDNLQALKSKLTDQFTFVFTDDMGGYLTQDVNFAFATWVGQQNDRFNSLVWSNEVALRSLTDTTSIWYRITQAEVKNCSIFDEVLYNNSERCFAYAGVFGSVDLSQTDSVMTAAFKSQDGLIPSVDDTEIANILNQKGINYYGVVTVEGGSIQTNIFYGGFLTGIWQFSDNLMDKVWVNYQVQTNLLRLQTTLPQIGSDKKGDAKIRIAISQAIQTALDNGIIAVGVIFDPIESLDILTKYGVSSQELTKNGYIILKNASTAFLRKNRMSPKWSIVYVRDSAVQFIPINTDTRY